MLAHMAWSRLEPRRWGAVALVVGRVGYRDAQYVCVVYGAYGNMANMLHHLLLCGDMQPT